MPQAEAINIDAMPAGAEMDALVAERVMGWWRKYYPPAAEDAWFDANGFRMKRGAWCPSEDIAAAWQVVEKMVADRHTQDFHFGYKMCAGCEWQFCFADKVAGVFSDCAGRAETMPLAVCRAALKAVAACA